MPADIELDGLEELLGALKKLENAGEAMGQALMAGAQVYEGFVKMSMNTPKSGRTYRRGMKSHTASAPGQAPAIDYGLLLNSVGSALESENAAIVFTSAEYGPALEFGTSRMQARPFMRPPADEHKSEIVAAVAETAKRKIDEASR